MRTVETLTGIDVATTQAPWTFDNGTRVNLFSHIVPTASIGPDCMIGEHCYIAGKVGARCSINNGSNVASTAAIADNCMIGDRCYIAGKMGAKCSIQNGNDIYMGVVLGDNVFIGPNCVFTNDYDPIRRHTNSCTLDMTIIEDNVTICAGVRMRPGHTIGRGAFIGMGATILRDIEPGERIVGGVVK